MELNAAESRVETGNGFLVPEKCFPFVVIEKSEKVRNPAKLLATPWPKDQVLTWSLLLWDVAAPKRHPATARRIYFYRSSFSFLLPSAPWRDRRQGRHALRCPNYGSKILTQKIPDIGMILAPTYERM